MKSQNDIGYIRYLQNLLEKNSIKYQSEQQYKNNNNKEKKQFVHGPLQTNLQATLFGDILIRYSRQMLLKQVGYQGQLKICKAKIGLIGAGGIGCPLALYLAGAGVGMLGIFDGDIVQLNNLHRQIAHTTASIGKSKTESLRQRLHALNPNIEIRSHPLITKQNLYLLDQYDLIIDGSDNPLCRYLVNDYLMSGNKKLLSGACVGWQGQITCYGNNSPCYRCIWGNDQISMGGCSTLGVIGTIPGIVGTILATEAIKLLINNSSSLQGYLLSYDGKNCKIKKSQLRSKLIYCQGCGNNKLNIQEYNYNKYASCSNISSNLPDVPNIQWSQLIQFIKENKEYKMIDVRTRTQYSITNIKNFVNIPYDQLILMNQTELAKVLQGKNCHIFVSCRIGFMSKKATDFLIKCGYSNTKNVQGGINQYGRLYDSNIVNF